MDAHLLPYSVAEQRGYLREARSIVKNRKKIAWGLTQLLELDEDKEKLLDYERQLLVVNDEREQAAKMVEILVENLKQIKVGKLATTLRRAREEHAEENKKAEKIKANEKAAKKAKAA